MPVDQCILTGCEREQLKKRIAEMKELHRMQLAFIAAISLCNTRTSAERERNIRPEYRTPELELVCDAVDREMTHREKVAELEADKAKLTVLVDELRHQIGGEREKNINAVANRACELLPVGFQIQLTLEQDAGWVELLCPDGTRADIAMAGDEDIFQQFNLAIDAATQEQGK